MTVKEYLQLTRIMKMQFFVSPGNFESINGRKEKWNDYSYPLTLNKWLDNEIERAFVLSDGTVRFFTHQPKVI